MNPLRLYAFFHLNLAFSSIEETQRSEVIERCYWPLLRLARRHRLPFGIEATGYTLETIATLDPDWIAELRVLLQEGVCEFIGSGYTQLIGPLTPQRVNTANQHLGIAVYEQFLGQRPILALVNEQTWSAGLTRHYLDAGYRAVIIEWDNAAATHPDWPSEWRYVPHHVLSADSASIPLIWNQSIAFQKFQRYAHDEITLDEYLTYLRRQIGQAPRAWSLYGNDVEIFNFRPGRYHTEAQLGAESEWERLERLFVALTADPDFDFIHPSAVLDLLTAPQAGQRLKLTSAMRPILVKKQDKYNILRWAVTGRADLAVNTLCWRLYQALQSDPDAGDAEWRELCELWSSDFRTHITETRWQAFRKRLDAALDRRGLNRQLSAQDIEKTQHFKALRLNSATPLKEKNYRLGQNERFLDIESDRLRLRLNLRRGLAIHTLAFREVCEQPLLGTLAHGYFDDIHWGADYYSGHMVLERPGYAKLTDLESTCPQWQYQDDQLTIVAEIATSLGYVEKRIQLDLSQGCVRLEYWPRWAGIPKGSLRLGQMTLLPEAFVREQLYYRTHNGGALETFVLDGLRVDHGQPVSLLISASHALGLTEGWIELGDPTRRVRIQLDPCQAACVGLLTYRAVKNTYFCRLAFSAGEIDDTCYESLWPTLCYIFTLSAHRCGDLASSIRAGSTKQPC